MNELEELEYRRKLLAEKRRILIKDREALITKIDSNGRELTDIEKRISKAKEFKEGLPERHGLAWENHELDSLEANLIGLIENRMRVHKRTRVAIICALKKALNEMQQESRFVNIRGIKKISI